MGFKSPMLGTNSLDLEMLGTVVSLSASAANSVIAFSAFALSDFAGLTGRKKAAARSAATSHHLDVNF